MKTQEFKGTIKTHAGKSITPALEYSGSASLYESADEVRAANKWPGDADIVEFLNADILNKTRTATVQATLEAAGYQKIGKRLADADYRFNMFVKTLVADGRSLAEAQELAKSLLK